MSKLGYQWIKVEDNLTRTLRANVKSHFKKDGDQVLCRIKRNLIVARQK
ncbi:hypothetical protein Hanom_Chr04g00323981 [Helianthus anomalus]